jgi:DNA-binding PucR family transcriptional regulator
MLKKIHDTLLSVVIEYDEKHKAQLYNTLRIYLFNNSSLQTTAKITFTHRNTINYRITKIRHLLDCDLDNAVVRFNLMMAFYISDYLRIIDMNLHS